MNVVAMIGALESMSGANVSFTKHSWNNHWVYNVSGNHQQESVAFTGKNDTFEGAVNAAYNKMRALQGAVPEAFGILPAPEVIDPPSPDEYQDAENMVHVDDNGPHF